MRKLKRDITIYIDGHGYRYILLWDTVVGLLSKTKNFFSSPDEGGITTKLVKLNELLLHLIKEDMFSGGLV